MSQQEAGKHTTVLSFRVDDDLAALLEQRIKDEQRKTGFDLSKAQIIEAALRKYLGNGK